MELPMKRVAIGVLLLFMTAGIGYCDTVLTGAGATFPYPIYSKWFDEYNKSHPDVRINYQSIGSGAGIKQIMQGTVDFGASDGPMTDAQIKEFAATHGSNILHFP